MAVPTVRKPLLSLSLFPLPNKFCLTKQDSGHCVMGKDKTNYTHILFKLTVETCFKKIIARGTWVVPSGG